MIHPNTLWSRLSRRARFAAENEDGVAIVLTAMMMVVMCGMAALGLDVGMLFAARRQTQNAADAAAHAAAQELPNLAAAQTAANDYWILNEPTLGTPSFAVSFPDSDSVRIEAHNEVEFFFAPILGFFSGDVEVAAQVGANAQPADVVIAVDTSGSMCRDSHGPMLNCPNVANLEPWNDVESATLAFPDYLLTRSDDWLGLVSYSSEATRQMPMSQGYPSYDTTVMSLHPSGYTNIGHALEVSVDTITQGRPNVDTMKIIVLVTDGVPNIYGSPGHWTNCGGSGCAAARNYALNVADDAELEGIRIYTIGLGNSVDASFLTDLAERTGGAYVESPTAADLETAFAEVARKARIKFTE
ncbi:MAG: VWA domain-containing protein [Dehalococcoidia bacterium]